MKTLFNPQLQHQAHSLKNQTGQNQTALYQKFGLLLVGGLIFMLMQGVTLAAVASTKHNLSNSGSGNKFNGTTEICVFCHTPHGASTAASAPLWNRDLSTATSTTSTPSILPPYSYATYASLGSTSLDAKTAPVGSVSIACLSCHDGTQAMDIMINTPGSGSTPMSGSWVGWGGQFNLLAAPAIAYIGLDLTNDHPVGIQYGGGGIELPAKPTGPTTDPDFKPPNYNGNAAAPKWWIETNSNATNEPTDLRLFTRDTVDYSNLLLPIAGGKQPFVECASCHDPHTTNGLFLRVSNDGSAVCLSCHIK